MFLKQKYIKNLSVYIILTLTLEIFSLFLIPQESNAALLLGTSDYITSDQVNETGVIHNVSFVIPASGHDIVATDYIRVVLTNFTTVTAASSISGTGGVPSFGVSGNVAWITGVTASAGDGIGISGITATNPGNPGDFGIIIQVANDVSGSVIYDSATTTAQTVSGVTTVNVRIGLDTSSIELFGYTSPGAFVTIMLNGSVSGTDIANALGNFHKKISGLDVNQNYSVGIFAQDTNLRNTATVSFVVYTLPNTNHIISNIVIPTTLVVDRNTISQGDPFVIEGRSHPLSQVTVFVDGATFSDVTTANTKGWWDYDYDSCDNALDIGSHISYGKEVVIGGFESIYTLTDTFIVQPCKTADLNCDGSVNLTDFSILMYYWEQYNPPNCRVDINNDGIVNLTDFSIMLFHWTG